MVVEVRGWIEDGELMAGVCGGEVRDEVKVGTYLYLLVLLYHYPRFMRASDASKKLTVAAMKYRRYL